MGTLGGEEGDVGMLDVFMVYITIVSVLHWFCVFCSDRTILALAGCCTCSHINLLVTRSKFVMLRLLLCSFVCSKTDAVYRRLSRFREHIGFTLAIFIYEELKLYFDKTKTLEHMQ
jgi:hypothetical protein